MIARELHLERTVEPRRTARAWLIDGADPARWLAEISRWEMADDRLALHALPGSLLVIAPDGATPAVTPAALAFGTIADRCWLPVDAVLRPAVTDAEAGALCGDVPLIFHPSLGPLPLPRDAALRVADLLAAPALEARPWHAAPDVPRPHPRIESIGFRLTLSLGDVFGAESREIGGEPPAGLPRAPGEPSNHPLSRGLRGIQRGLFGAAKWTLDHLPGGGAGGGLDRWLGEQLDALSRQLALSRNKAVLRLLEQLKNDPEEGLRHALPLNDSALHRGTATPSARLGDRVADFDLKRLGGGRERDSWSVPDDVRAALRQRYLELAERERQLGRHRRAAYIYAELLGDLVSAAKTLAAGGHWQEAALVYRDHVRSPLEAARCFAEGRIFAEAIKLYEERDAFAQLGALYLKMGDEAKAEGVFRKWVAQLVSRDDLLGAAAILEGELGARDESLALLESGWPASSQAVQCVGRFLALRGARGEHDATARLLARIGADKVPAASVLALLAVLGDAQRTYPDRPVRAQAEDIGRCLIAERLESADASRRGELIRALANLAPDDPLLAQDAHRFFEGRRALPPPLFSPKLPPPGALGETELRLLHELCLPFKTAVWRIAAGCDDGLVAAGTDGGTVRAARAGFGGSVQDIAWSLALPSGLIGNLILAASADRVFLALRWFDLLGTVPEKEMPAHDGFARGIRIGVPPWNGETPFAATYAQDRTLWTLRTVAGDLVLTGHGPDGSLRGNFTVPPVEAEIYEDPENAGNAPALLACAGTEVLLARQTQLHRFSGKTETSEPIEFAEPIMALASPPRWSTPHLAVALRTEVHLCWLGPHNGTCHPVCTGMENPVIGFSADGTLIVFAADAGFLFDCDSRGRRRGARFPWPHPAVIAIVPGPTARTFGTLDAQGAVRWFGFSPGDFQ